MKGITVFLLCLAASSAVELPTVLPIRCTEANLSSFDKCLNIKFSYVNEYAGLSVTHGYPDVLVGQLYDTSGTVKDDSRVSVSIVGDVYYVIIHDPSDEELYKLKVDIATGVAVMDMLPTNVQFDESIIPEEVRDLPMVPLEREEAMPPQGFMLKVQPLIDSSWRARWGDGSAARVEAVMEHARTFFKHSSLGTKYELDVQPVNTGLDDTRLTAKSEDLRRLRYYVRDDNDMPLANTYPLFVMRDGRGAAGIAYVGTACHRLEYLRTNINEYYGDVATAEILVHEIGHNLNMRHDFLRIQNGQKVARVSSHGLACTNVGGYMDYYVDKNQWSPCSLEDITKYYNYIGSVSYGQNCMKLLPEEPTTTTMATTTTTAGCADPDLKGDGWCNDENNTPECDYDGGDCCGCDTRAQRCTECLCKEPNIQCPTKDCRATWWCERKKSRNKCVKNWVRHRCPVTCEASDYCRE